MVMFLHVWPNAIPVKNISAPLHGARVRILILSDFASAMIADKLLVTTTMTHPSWLEAVQWCVLAGGRSLPLLLLLRLLQESHETTSCSLPAWVYPCSQHGPPSMRFLCFTFAFSMFRIAAEVLPAFCALPLPESIETIGCVYFVWVAFAFCIFAIACEHVALPTRLNILQHLAQQVMVIHLRCWVYFMQGNSEFLRGCI